jgi:hypothetical protein
LNPRPLGYEQADRRPSPSQLVARTHAGLSRRHRAVSTRLTAAAEGADAGPVPCVSLSSRAGPALSVVTVQKSVIPLHWPTGSPTKIIASANAVPVRGTCLAAVTTCLVCGSIDGSRTSRQAEFVIEHVAPEVCGRAETPELRAAGSTRAGTFWPRQRAGAALGRPGGTGTRDRPDGQREAGSGCWLLTMCCRGR